MKKIYTTPVVKKIDSIKNKTLGTYNQGSKDGTAGWDGRDGVKSTGPAGVS